MSSTKVPKDVEMHPAIAPAVLVLITAAQHVIGRLYFSDQPVAVLVTEFTKVCQLSASPVLAIVGAGLVARLLERMGSVILHRSGRSSASLPDRCSTRAELLKELQLPTSVPLVVKHAACYMRQHYPENVTWLTLASLTHREPSSFARLFRQSAGRTIHQYLALARVSASMSHIEAGDKIDSIALTVGWSRKSYYSQFRRLVGDTPAGYRRRHESPDIHIPNSLRPHLGDLLASRDSHGDDYSPERQ